MLTSLLTLRIRSRRDVLVARQRVRQVAGLLRFSPRRQHAIAAAVFEIALALTHRPGGGAIAFDLDGDVLHVRPQARKPAPPPLVEPLPEPTQAPAPEDLPWLVEQLTRHTSLDLFDEIRCQNHALLLALQELEGGQSEIDGRSPERHHPAA